MIASALKFLYIFGIVFIGPSNNEHYNYDSEKVVLYNEF